MNKQKLNRQATDPRNESWEANRMNLKKKEAKHLRTRPKMTKSHIIPRKEKEKKLRPSDHIKASKEASIKTP